MFIDKLVVSASCSLMHTAVDLVNETKLDSEIKSWLAFAAQKVVEVNALAKALAGRKDEVKPSISIRWCLLLVLSSCKYKLCYLKSKFYKLSFVFNNIAMHLPGF